MSDDEGRFSYSLECFEILHCRADSAEEAQEKLKEKISDIDFVESRHWELEKNEW